MSTPPQTAPVGPRAAPLGELTVEVVDLVPGGRALVRVVGELDLATADLLAGPLQDVVAGGARLVELDVRAMAFCDLAGLDVLLATAAALQPRHGRLVLLDPCWSLAKLLDIRGRAGEPDDVIDVRVDLSR